MRAKPNLLKRFNLIWVVQSWREKYFAFHPPPIDGYLALSRLTQRGASRSSRTLMWDAVDADGAADEGT
jgi:hypothetical protein